MRVLGIEHGATVVFDDALTGVAAGRAGGFGCMIGVDRIGQADEPLADGADRIGTKLVQTLEPPVLEEIDPR